MNDRIRELAEQAGCKVMDDGEWWVPSAKGLEKVVYTSGVGLEKFAELIVRECANTAYQSLYEDRAFDDSPNNIRCNVMDAIKKHFGVEE